MKNHYGYDNQRDCCLETEEQRSLIPNPIDIAANLTYGLSLAYKAITFPIRRSFEKLTSRTVEGICNMEGIEEKEL